ncbi:hypothetical protein [Inquilinus limosus]|uniref:Uncharacterized protein n=1 Tax=Inquilinus limosus TaxID=171674 RepID=A0A211ZU93_9PROT|nr:hypothetical protein [Inquilinus limosus]OWJ68845.1 hypothetical protein BWR60_01785 [Inquilinus limosus]
MPSARSLSPILLRRAAVLSIRKRLKWPLALDHAEFEAFLKGLCRTKAARPVRKAALLEPNLLAASLVLTPEAHAELSDLGGGEGEGRRTVRDMPLLLTGFRRSKLAALDVRDWPFSPKGVVLFVGRSKADQEGHARLSAVAGLPSELFASGKR